VSRIAIIGAGSWGTALAITLARGGTHQVRLWAHEAEVARNIAEHHVNRQYLPDCEVPANVEAGTNYECVLRDADIVLTVMPSHHVRRVAEQIKPYLHSRIPVVSATKGVEAGTHLRMTEVLTDVLATECIGALSGPSFAREVAKGDPTAITFATTQLGMAEQIQRELSGPTFRVYSSDDVIGVELGGALKNVIAIAAGIVEGLSLGHNTAAALITRGLAEISRLAVACGAQRETLAGLSGMGDLVLTCTGGLSRNRSVGVALGQGRKLSDIIAGMHGMVAEGVMTTDAALGLASDKGIEMPITAQMHLILHEGKDPRAAMRDLLMRPWKNESA
jgi:glycerol-3-phosphate dehydrogenase (NAD(P)+)